MIDSISQSDLIWESYLDFGILRKHWFLWRESNFVLDVLIVNIVVWCLNRCTDNVASGRSSCHTWTNLFNYFIGWVYYLDVKAISNFCASRHDQFAQCYIVISWWITVLSVYWRNRDRCHFSYWILNLSPGRRSFETTTTSCHRGETSGFEVWWDDQC